VSWLDLEILWRSLSSSLHGRKLLFSFRKMTRQWMSTFAVSGNSCSLSCCFIADDEICCREMLVGGTAEVQKPWSLLPSMYTRGCCIEQTADDIRQYQYSRLWLSAYGSNFIRTIFWIAIQPDRATEIALIKRQELGSDIIYE